jgi:polyphosphate kinase
MALEAAVNQGIADADAMLRRLRDETEVPAADVDELVERLIVTLQLAAARWGAEVRQVVELKARLDLIRDLADPLAEDGRDPA